MFISCYQKAKQRSSDKKNSRRHIWSKAEIIPAQNEPIRFFLDNFNIFYTIIQIVQTKVLYFWGFLRGLYGIDIKYMGYYWR